MTSGVPTEINRAVLLRAEFNQAGKWVDHVHGLAGSRSLHQQLGGLRFRLSPLAFFQTNTRQTELMYGAVAEAAGVPCRCPPCTLQESISPGLA